MKALCKQGRVCDEFSDGFQRRVGNRSRVGLALWDYGIRPGQSCSLSPTLLLFHLRVGDGMIRGECPNVHHGAGTGTDVREPTAREPAGPSLPRCPNPVLKHFLRSHPSLESSHAPSAAVSTNRATPSTAAPCGGYLKHLAFSGSDWKLLLKN